MKKHQINIDFDDLLFESRNKDYGAYQLRRKYNSTVTAGIIIASIIGCLLVIVPLVPRPSSHPDLTEGSRFVQIDMDNLELPKESIYPPAPSPAETEIIQKPKINLAPEVIDTVVPMENSLATADEILASTGNIYPEIKNSGISKRILPREDKLVAYESFALVDVLPSFKGGDEQKFREWVGRRTNYPKEAVNKKIKGTVLITFIIETDGSVSNVSIVKGVNPLLDNEAVRVISESPKWSPGLQRGHPVRIRFIIPFIFSPV